MRATEIIMSAITCLSNIANIFRCESGPQKMPHPPAGRDRTAVWLSSSFSWTATQRSTRCPPCVPRPTRAVHSAFFLAHIWLSFASPKALQPSDVSQFAALKYSHVCVRPSVDHSVRCHPPSRRARALAVPLCTFRTTTASARPPQFASERAPHARPLRRSRPAGRRFSGPH